MISFTYNIMVNNRPSRLELGPDLGPSRLELGPFLIVNIDKSSTSTSPSPSNELSNQLGYSTMIDNGDVVTEKFVSMRIYSRKAM